MNRGDMHHFVNHGEPTPATPSDRQDFIAIARQRKAQAFAKVLLNAGATPSQVTAMTEEEWVTLTATTDWPVAVPGVKTMKVPSLDTRQIILRLLEVHYADCPF